MTARTIIYIFGAWLLLGLCATTLAPMRALADVSCPPDFYVSTPAGFPTKAATITIHPGITSTCVVHLPGGGVLRADGDTAAPYNQSHAQGRAIFRISGRAGDNPYGVNIVVTASSTNDPNAPELLPQLFADATVTLPQGTELVYFEPGTGRYILDPNAHIRRCGLYKIIRRGVTALQAVAAPARPRTLPATGASPFGGLLEVAGAMILVGLGIARRRVASLIGHKRVEPERSSGETAGLVLCVAGFVLAVGLSAWYAIAASRPTPAQFGSLAESSGGIAPRIAGSSRPPTRLLIARLGIDTPVLSLGIANGAWQVPAYAAGFLSNSALPGHAGNEAITAHDDRDGSIFRNLGNVRPGDIAIVYAGTRAFRYRVTAMRDVMPTRIDVLAPTNGATLTLITCTPYLVDTQRLIVRAHLIE